MGLRDRPVLITLVMVALAAIAGLASACTSSEPGNPTATTGGSSASTGPQPSASAPTLPMPPTSGAGGTTIAHPIDLSGVKPCSLFTPGVSSVAETAGTTQKVSVPRLPNAAGCFQFNESKNVGLILAVSSNIDVDSFSRSLASQAERFSVHGYPGVVIAPPAPQAVCFAGVGMGDHQLLYLQYALANPGAQPQVPQPQLCAKLQPIAEQVVAQLAQ